ncbi:MAG: CoB--CoM heterodisulfide reductase iron-sulfur subunit B family protein [Candidatus Hodarchaeales archaeon]|jgi:heterodisulfide reductase subunit B
MKVGYYPGCSLHKVAKEYNKSTHRIAAKLGVEMKEIKDWNCCGALEVEAVNPLAAKGIVARNLAIAEEQNFDLLTAVCPACAYQLINVNRIMEEDKEEANDINSLMDNRNYTPGSVKPVHFLQLLRDNVGLEKIKERILPDNPLAGRKGVSYYGCLCVRPKDIVQFEDPDNPTFMDDLINIVGAETPHFPMKTKCCGATQLLVAKPTVETLTGNIIVNAKEVGAEFIVVACQMCALALDGQQKQAIKRVGGGNFKIPILYFSQLLGIGMGLDYKSLGLGSNYVSPKKLMKSVKA